MIIGIGTDICSVERIRNAMTRHGDRFARHILAEAEWAAFKRNRKPANYLARRFAAKEALSKALGTGLVSPVRWPNIAIGHDARGKPRIDASPVLARFMQAQGIARSHISISDERDLAVAFVILES
ncbi:MAG: holo-ACP synthase [Burkholderiales bacterium]